METMKEHIAVMVLCAAVLAGLSACAKSPTVRKDEPAPPPVVQEAPKPPPPLELETVRFIYDSPDLTREARESLNRTADKLLARPGAKVVVDGHCDERGTDQYNMDLGWKRAYAVRDYLRKMGIADERMYPASYGRARPAVVGNDEGAWLKNRRVEMSEKK
jgi:peptidoglycan-associated lipoprotein